MTEVKPIDTLESLLAFPEGIEHAKAHDWVGALKARTKGRKLDGETTDDYKTLVCHDLAGGYGEDRFCDGSTVKNTYRFFNWYGVDTFIYFSHHFITIPPCGWTYTCHNHGVKILGTMISEWDAGKQIWQEILASDESVDNVVEALVKVTLAFKFDGWLLNIENYINSDKVDRLISFVKKLTDRLHEENSEFEVIWYDSVTVEGNLSYQNQLNDKNSAFFDVCDGIFLNYGWGATQLENSKAYAGDRYLDVYVGVDVWGRGTYGGGGYGASTAMELIRSYPLSVALFAQGWTYEVLGYLNFFGNENNFWASLMPYLLYHGPVELPISTSFCQGFGDDRYEDGELVQEGAWYHLKEQQLQPIWESLLNTCKMTTLKNQSIYEGGSSVSIWSSGDTTIRLLVTNLLSSDLSQAIFTYSFQNGFLNVQFYFEYEEIDVEEKENKAETINQNTQIVGLSQKDKIGYLNAATWPLGAKHTTSPRRKTMTVKPTKTEKRESWLAVMYDFTELSSAVLIVSVGLHITCEPGVLNFGKLEIS